MSIKDDFVSLHTHTHASTFDGLGTEEQFCKRVEEMGQDAVSFTEHGTLSGLHSAHMATMKMGLKLIPGLEAYVADDAELKGLTEDDKKAIKTRLGDKAAAAAAIKEENAIRRERDHVTIWALNDVGLRNLYRLSSWSWGPGYHQKPRIDLKRLRQFNEGLAVSTGCPGGIVASPLKDGKLDVALQRLEELLDVFGNRLYAEVMPHPPHECPEQASKIARLAEAYGIPLLATQDAHYPKREDADVHECRLCISTRDSMANRPADPGCTGGRFTFDSKTYFLRTRAEMEEALGEMPKFRTKWIQPALDNTVLFAERCTAKLYDPDLSPELVKKGWLSKAGRYLSTPPLPAGVKDYDHWLRRLCRDGIRERFGCDFAGLPSVYQERLTLELARMSQLGFSSYFVLVQDVRQWALQQDIECGPGRGSAAGSLVCYVLGITDVDPVPSGLSFDRFLPEGRCFVPGTMISTSTGLVPIEDVDVGTLVRTRDGLRRVLATHSRQVDEFVVELSIETGRGVIILTTTENHAIFAWNDDGEEVEVHAGKIKEGDRLVSADYMPSVWQDVLALLEVQSEGVLLKAVRERAEDRRGDPVPGGSGSHVPLRREVREGHVEPSSVRRRMPEEVGQGSEVDLQDMQLLRRGVHGPSHCEVLLAEVREARERSPRRLSREDGLPGGSGVLREVSPGGGLCSHDEVEERADQVRAVHAQAPVRSDVHSRLPPGETETGRRVEGLEGARLGEGAAGGGCGEGGRVRLPRHLPEGCGVDGEDVRLHPARDPEQGEVGSVQAEGKNLRSLREHVRSDPDERHEDVLSLLRQLGQETNEEGSQPALLRPDSGWRVEAVHRRRYAGAVYDLSVDERHEYIANGVVVHNSELPDIDADYDMDSKERIIQYLQGRYGEDRVCLIGSFNTFGGKAALTAAARIYDLPTWATQPVTGLVVTAIEEEAQSDETLGDVLDRTDAGKAFEREYPMVCKVARRLEGQKASSGVHAAGIIVSSEPLASLIPLESRERIWNGVKVRIPCAAWDMRQIEYAGLVKIDALGLMTLSQLYHARKTIERLLGRSFSWVKEVPVNDEAALRIFRDNKFVGVFQYDTASSRRLCDGFAFRGYDDVSLMTALNRPGPTKSGLADLFLERVVDATLIPEVPSSIAHIVEPTCGCIIYQEQVIEIAKCFAGYTPAEADGFRKKIGKKLGLSDEEEKFINGAVERGEDKDYALKLFSDIREFASYGFNKAHAYSYGLVSVWTAWAKAHYPGAFLSGCLSKDSQSEKRYRYVLEARRLGIPVLSPDVNYSEGAFSLSPDGEIVGSVQHLHGVGEKAATQIASLKPYVSLTDFIQRNVAAGKAVNSKVFGLLAKADAFRGLWPDQAPLVAYSKEVWEAGKKGDAEGALVRLPKVKPLTPDQKTELISEINPLYFPDTGDTLFEIQEAKVAAILDRALYAIGDEALEGVESALVFGRLSSTKLFSDKHGRSARIALLGPNGEEMTVKVDTDPCDRYYSRALAKKGNHVVALCRFWQGRASLDAAWLAKDITSRIRGDAVLDYMLDRVDSSPKDLAKTVRRLAVGTTFSVKGLLVAGKVFDSSRGPWARFSILSRYSYQSVACFSKQYEAMPDWVEFGKPVEFTATKSDRGLVMEAWPEVDEDSP